MTESQKLEKILKPITAPKTYERESLRRVHQSKTHIEASDSFTCVRITNPAKESDKKFPNKAITELIRDAEANEKHHVVLDINLLEKVATAMRRYAKHKKMVFPYVRITFSGEAHPIVMRFDSILTRRMESDNAVGCVMPVKE